MHLETENITITSTAPIWATHWDVFCRRISKGKYYRGCRKKGSRQCCGCLWSACQVQELKIGVIMDLETEFVLWIWKDKAVRDSESEI